MLPSLPGYGFSDKPAEAGWGVPCIARAWAALMAGLGYDRYGALGGDWGAAVTAGIGAQDPEHFLGIHLNMPLAPSDPDTMDNLTPTEQTALEAVAYYNRWDGGYSAQQGSRPQTLSYGLTDPPSGQAAWIIEKFWAWTDCNGHPENALTRDEMLDDVMMYWLPAAAPPRLASTGRASPTPSPTTLRSRSRPAPRSSSTRSSAPPIAGWNGASPTSSIGTSSTKAATSPPSRLRR